MKLGNYVTIRTGKLDANAANRDGKYPFFTCSSEPLRINSYSFDCECVLVAGNGELNAKYYNGKFDAYQRTYIIESKNEKLDTKYLYYYFVNYIKELRKQAIGGVIKYIKLGNLTDAEIKLPDKETQISIVNELLKINSEIENCNKNLKSLEELTKSRFNEMFGSINNEHSFKECSLGDEITTLADFSANGSYAKLDSNVKMYDEPNFAWMVRTTDLENENFIDIKYIDEKAYNLLSKSKLYGNELIMCKIGSAGKIYLMPKVDRPASLGRNAFLIKFNEQTVNMTYLFAYLNTYDLQKDIQQRVKGAVTKTITKDEVRSIPLILPPKSLQDEYSSFVEQIDKLKFNVQKQIKYYQELLDLKMHEYFDVEEED